MRKSTLIALFLSLAYSINSTSLDNIKSILGKSSIIQTNTNGRIVSFYPGLDNTLDISPSLSPAENAVNIISNHPELFLLNPDELLLEVNDRKDKLSYVIFRQTVGQVPIYQSKIDFRFRDNDKLLMSKMVSYQNPIIDTSPSISIGIALDIVKLETDFSEQRNDVIVNVPQLFVYVENGELPSYRLGWFSKIQIHHRTPFVHKRAVSFYEVWIDAHTGELFSIVDRAEDSEIIGRVTAMVKDLPYGTASERPLEDLRVQISDVGDTYTDEDGYYALEAGTTQRDVTIDFYGHFLNIDTRNATDASITASVTPGDTLNFFFDDLTSLPSERDTYFHANLIHDWITDLDNDFTGADYIMPAAVNIGSEDSYWPCNAYWDGTGINMFSAGGGCSDTGEMADVVYHEYQHGLTQFAYDPFSSPYASGMGEGFSDYTSMTIRNTACMGDAFFGTPGVCLRDGENNRQFPGNECGGSVHCLGEITMGSMWQMRKNLINLYGDTLAAVAHSDTLFRWAMFGRPNTVPEFLDEILIADDDDGTLLNGTPHFSEIADAFGQHNVYASIPEYGIAHTPVLNMESAPAPILVEAIISSIHGEITNAQLHYTVLGTTTSLDMIEDGDSNVFQAYIPALPPGTIVQYYIEASDVVGNDMIVPETAPAIQYFFLIGSIESFPIMAEDDAETDNGWTYGIGTDQATSGIWERVDPIGTQSSSIQVQPEDDHTPTGVNCFVTGNAEFDGTNAGENDVDGGNTTLVSPIYDLSGIVQPIFSYWRWYTNNAGDSGNQDTWLVQISNDSQTWITIEETMESESSWIYKQYLVDQFIEPSNSVQFRFIAEDIGDGSLVEAAVDDLEIRSGLSLDVDPGDMDFSNTLDIFDILAMTDAILSPAGPNGIQTYVGDINNDGRLNIMDVITLVQMILYN